MQTFHLLYFRDSLLEWAEEIRARSAIEAVQKAAGQPSEIRVEIWSENDRVAIISEARGEKRYMH